VRGLNDGSDLELETSKNGRQKLFCLQETKLEFVNCSFMHIACGDAVT
jgi:hypothetical protein